MTAYDMVVIGAGPAGMAAAIEGRAAGLTALVLDEQPRPGGQIYRGVEAADERRHGVLGPDYGAGRDLAERFRASGADYWTGATVWNIDSERQVDVSLQGRSRSVTASALVVATGATERATPLPGWTLPGVMTAGAMQILLKAYGIVEEDVVFVGSGPLLWLIASQMVTAGTPPRAIVEMVPRSRYLAAARHLPGALAAGPYLAKGSAMLRAVKRAGVPVHRDARDIRIEGDTAVEAVSFTSSGRPKRIETGHVALHQGVVPNQQITRLLGCEHRWSESQRCFVPVLDEHMESTVTDVFVTGDGSGIAGATSAALRGRLAAMRIAERATGSAPAERDGVRTAIARDGRVRPFLEALYPPSQEVLAPADGTIVCRCEEITAGQVREAVRLGASGPNQVKSFLRAGMGPCQGRMCGLTVTEIIAAERGTSPSVVDYYRIRPPLKPLPLSELADMGDDEADPIAAE